MNNCDTSRFERSISPEVAISVFLHDSLGKALKISGQAFHAARYLALIPGEVEAFDAIKANSSPGDRLAAIAEPLPMPHVEDDGRWTAGFEEGRLRVHHPLGGASLDVPVPAIDEAQIMGVIKGLCSGIANRRALFRLLWRCLPERMASIDSIYAVLPADMRLPDHSIWHYADTEAAFAGAVGTPGGESLALLSFAISPVQSFIAAARSLRDLRNGSLLLSWLAFRAMRPVLQRVGPAALIFPALRGNALMDLWLRSDAGGLGSKISQPPDDRLLSPSLPNRFLAVVPAGPDGVWAQALAEAVEAAATGAWREVAKAVRDRLGKSLDGTFPGWDSRWQTQIDQSWDFVASVLPLRTLGTDKALAQYRGAGTFAKAFPEAQKIRDLNTSTGGAQTQIGRWQASVEMAARLLESARGVRRVPIAAPSGGNIPAKCSLLGTWEQMGPGEREEAKTFWQHLVGKTIAGARVRPGEALCAVALVKRFAMGAFLQRELGLTQSDGFSDTATVAARSWLNRRGAEAVKRYSEHVDWNGQWLHWARPDAEADAICGADIWRAIQQAKTDLGPPPSYYAVLMLDGDSMGDWLAGKKSPKLREAMHPDLAGYVAAQAGTSSGLDAHRPVVPALHAAISEALSNFAQYVAPEIVRRYQGELIYAGGDDVLALLPTETVLACAQDLEQGFRGDPGKNGGAASGYYRADKRGQLMMMGPCATVSVGVAVVHHKEDLRAALELGRAAERDAKAFGKNALSLTVARRSGEHTSAALPWTLVGDLAAAVVRFGNASDRWAYRLRGLLPVFDLEGPPEDAFKAEIQRQLKRGDDEATRELPVVAFFEQLPMEKPWIRKAERLLTLWQSASFLARGRDVAGRS